jgi:Protein of unknown function (DUF3108)
VRIIRPHDRNVGLAAGLLAVAAAHCCGPAQAQTDLAAHYAISLAGIPIGEGDWTVEIGKDRYTSRASGAFVGIWRALIGGNVSATTRGVSRQGRPLPTSYEADFALDEDIDEVRVVFHDGVASEPQIKPSPLPARPDRVPLTDAHLRGGIDPLTAGLVPAAATGEALAPAACQRTLPVFDGGHRYDLALSFKRMDKIKPESGYQGPVVVCAMIYQPVAGHSPSGYRVRYLARARGMEMWLAPFNGTRFLAPVRISIPTVLGAAVVEATRFESATK